MSEGIRKAPIIYTILTGEGALIAKTIIDLNTLAINTHIDASCYQKPECMNLVTTSLENLPTLVPALIGLVLVGLYVGACSMKRGVGRNGFARGRFE